MMEDAVVRPGERPLLDDDVLDDMHSVDIDVRVREGPEPAAEELDAGGLALPADPARCLDENDSPGSCSADGSRFPALR